MWSTEAAGQVCEMGAQLTVPRRCTCVEGGTERGAAAAQSEAVPLHYWSTAWGRVTLGASRVGRGLGCVFAFRVGL